MYFIFYVYNIFLLLPFFYFSFHGRHSENDFLLEKIFWTESRNFFKGCLGWWMNDKNEKALSSYTKGYNNNNLSYADVTVLIGNNK